MGLEGIIPREQRYVLKKPLDFDEKIKEAAEICGESGREIIAVIRLRDIAKYLRVRRAIKNADEKINISYRFQRPDYRGDYSKGPYFMELDCLKFKKPD